ncbi:MAG: 4Fe-4S binding protein [Bacteroidales bacterium]|nr:4Fe-4S binding protein [Bacteroidales bacterium]
MKEIVILSGKGGTGKTSITASFAYLARHIAVIADCDVDAADLHLILKPTIKRKEDFYSSLEAVIDQEKCISCGKCERVCRFDAISSYNRLYDVIGLNCEGCGYCEKVCPVDAIKMKQKLDGEWYISESRYVTPLVHAKLGIGTENSGKLVALVKNIAKQIAERSKKEIVLVDGSPGVGCPVISSLSGANYIVFVTEPTVSGVHDLKRVFELASKYHIPSGLIINKADLNREKTQELIEFAKNENINFLGQLPYDEVFTKAMVTGLSIVEFDKQNNISQTITQMWEQIMDY